MTRILRFILVAVLFIFAGIGVSIYLKSNFSDLFALLVTLSFIAFGFYEGKPYYRDKKVDTLREEVIRKYGEEEMHKMVDFISDPKMKSLLKEALEIEDNK